MIEETNRTLTSNEYNERYSRKVPIQLGDLEQFVMAFGVVDDYIEWMRFFKGVDIPGNGPAVIKQLKEARTLALALYNAPPPSETYDGLPVSQEPKYTVTNGRLVNRASGKPIPDDEPVFILRAKDRVAVYAIMAYRAQCTGNPEHHDAVDARVGDFLRFKEAHPQRIKSPDTTALKAGACPPIDAKLNASIEAVAKVLQEEAASDPTFPVRGVANYAGLAGRIIRAVAGSKEKS